MVLEQRVASAQVLLAVDVADFDVVVGLQHELGEEVEAKMLDVLSRTLGGPKEVSVQVDQLLDRLLPTHLFLFPRLHLPEHRQQFLDRAVQLDFLLYPRNILEHIVSSGAPQQSDQRCR